MFRNNPQHTGYSTSDAPDTSALLWTYPTGDYVDSSAAVVDGKVYFASQDFKVYCLNAETGPLIWSYMTGANMYSSPAIANGIMYVGSNDGTLYAFGSPQLRYFNDMFALNSVHG